MDRTVTAVLVAAIMAMSCCVLLVSDEGDAATTTVGNYDGLKDALADANVDTIIFSSNIAVDAQLEVGRSVTLDLNGFVLTSSDGFKGSYENDIHLVNVTGDNITIKNGTLKTTALNKNALNLYGAVDVILQDLVVDHTESSKGAPLIVNGSSVTLGGKITFITGSNSWYAVNVDNSVDIPGEVPPDKSSLTSLPSTNVYFEGTSSLGIIISDPDEGDEYSVSFGDNTKFHSNLTSTLL